MENGFRIESVEASLDPFVSPIHVMVSVDKDEIKNLAYVFSEIFQDSKEKSIGYIYPKKHMRTIDFDKILSIEKREQALSKKKLVDIIRNPDHSPLYERTKIFKYHTLQNKSKIPQKIKCFNSYMNYNPNKAYKIRIVHYRNILDIYFLI